MHERIDHGANLLKNHVFQFDFLNDDFTKLPQSLQDIINDEAKRKKLVIYINPPYAEATSAKTITGTGENKTGVTTNFKINDQLKPKIGNASNEIFALFMANIYEKVPGCILGQFSTLKFVNSSNFKKFKDYFLANYMAGFIVPAETFDNVKGKFPIGFTIWNTSEKLKIQEIATDVFDKNGNYNSSKRFYGNLPNSINNWIVKHQSKKEESIGTLFYRGNDFQNQNYIYIDLGSTKAHDSELYINTNNLLSACIYLAIRQCIDATWLNDRDQFLYPNDNWKTDSEFHNDCLVYALFHGQNKISNSEGINNWIPFTEQEVNAQEKFASHFMTDFIKGKISPTLSDDNGEQQALFKTVEKTPPLGTSALLFSEEAAAVFDAGRELWKYFHAQNDINVNASLYDIRAYFQGRNATGRMNTKSDDAQYMTLIGDLRKSLVILADKIKPKVYEYGFLKE